MFDKTKLQLNRLVAANMIFSKCNLINVQLDWIFKNINLLGYHSSKLSILKH